MDEGRRKQIKGLIKKQKKLIRLASTDYERAVAYGVWSGFLSGMWLTGAITEDEYDCLYAEMVKFKEIA